MSDRPDRQRHALRGPGRDHPARRHGSSVGPPGKLDRLLSDSDANRLTAATDQVEVLSAALAEDLSPPCLGGGYAAVARARADYVWAARETRRILACE